MCITGFCPASPCTLGQGLKGCHWSSPSWGRDERERMLPLSHFQLSRAPNGDHLTIRPLLRLRLAGRFRARQEILAPSQLAETGNFFTYPSLIRLVGLVLTVVSYMGHFMVDSVWWVGRVVSLYILRQHGCRMAMACPMFAYPAQ